MLGGAGDDVVALFASSFENPFDRQVVRFARSGGKDDLLTAGPEQTGNLLAARFDGAFRVPAKRVIAACRVAKIFLEKR